MDKNTQEITDPKVDDTDISKPDDTDFKKNEDIAKNGFFTRIIKVNTLELLLIALSPLLLYQAINMRSDLGKVEVGQEVSQKAPSIITEDMDESLLDESLVQSSINEIDPDLTVRAIKPTSFYGLFAAEVDNGMVLYVNYDGSAILHGTLLEKEGSEFVNKTEKVRMAYAKDVLSNVDEEDFIEFKSDREQAKVIVFTDPDCPYCQKLHSEVETLNEVGITVRYLPFGRGGPGSASFDTVNSIWCADDRQEALTQVKQGDKLEPVECGNIAQRYYDLGASLNVAGTPYIFLEDGDVIKGYLPAAMLVEILDSK